MYFSFEDDDLLEKYNTICNKVSPNKKKDCDRESIYMKVFLKAKIKSHSDEVTDFCDRNFLR